MKKKNGNLAGQLQTFKKKLESLGPAIDAFFNFKRGSIQEGLTLVHGDFKAANMFFNEKEASVTFNYTKIMKKRLRLRLIT